MIAFGQRRTTCGGARGPSRKKKKRKPSKETCTHKEARLYRENTVTRRVSALRPRPKQTEILMWGIMGERARKLFGLFGTR